MSRKGLVLIESAAYGGWQGCWRLSNGLVELVATARAQARTPEFRQAYPTRSMIERVIAWTATQNGRRIRLRYIGTVKNDAWLHARCGAINLRTLVKAGLTPDGRAWVLA